MNKKIQRFEDLAVWQKAHQVALEAYKITKDFPGDEKFGLVSQARRAVASIASNIAEQSTELRIAGWRMRQRI